MWKRLRRATVQTNENRSYVMRSLVVYESIEGEVDLLSVDDAVPSLQGVDLLVVGARRAGARRWRTRR
jgi:hypothetical protein